MSFSYNFCDGTNDAIDFPRILVSDTQEFQADGVTRAYVFENSEITGVTRLVARVWQSGQFYSMQGGLTSLANPNVIPYYRIAATLLDSLASNSARLSGVVQLLDVKLSLKDAALALRNQAEQYRDMEDNNGAFAIIEQVNNQFSFRDRFWKTVQRQGIV